MRKMGLFLLFLLIGLTIVSAVPAYAASTYTVELLCTPSSPGEYGHGITLTAHVTPPDGVTGPATGYVSFMDTYNGEVNSLYYGSLSSGSVSTTIYPLPPGSHSFNATYNGETSNVVAYTIDKATTTTTLRVSSSSAVYGNSTTLTATVTRTSLDPDAHYVSDPYGNVTFKDGGTVLNTVGLRGDDAVYTISYPYLSAGTHSFTAEYNGDDKYETSTDTASYTVSQAHTYLVVQNNLQRSPTYYTDHSYMEYYGSDSSIGVSVRTWNGNPTGSVTVYNSDSAIGTYPMEEYGTWATIPVGMFPPGNYHLSFDYGGDTNFSSSGSSWDDEIVLNIIKADTYLYFNNPGYDYPPEDTCHIGQPYDIQLNLEKEILYTDWSDYVISYGVPMGGTIDLYQDGTKIKSFSLSKDSVTVSKTQSVTLSTPGTYVFNASYSGDANYTASYANTTTWSQFILHAKSDTTTALISSINPTVYGQSTTFTATVSPVSPGTGTPAGTVTFYDGGTQFGSPVSLSGGQASVTTEALTVGSHSITAVYSGSDGYFGSTSPAVTQRVNQASTTTVSVSSANPSVFGESVYLNATVTPVAPGGGTPTGRVAYFDGVTEIGSATLSSGKATFSTSTLSVGSHTITAIYVGSTGYAGSTASVLTQTVNRASTTANLEIVSTPSTYGQSVSYVARVTAVAPGSGVPGGSVDFYGDGAKIGSVTLSSGQATFSTSAWQAGSYPIYAIYSGNTNFVGATTVTHDHVVNQAIPTVGLESSLNPALWSHSVTLTATMTGSGETPAGQVTFLDGVTPLGTATLSGGVATLSTSALSVGSHSLTASYGGDINYSTHTSDVLVQAVSSNPPVLTFSANVTSAEAPLTVQFTDTSGLSLTGYQWNFGDGTANSTEKNPVHRFGKGKFTVTLTATNGGGTSTIQKIDYIVGLPQKHSIPDTIGMGELYNRITEVLSPTQVATPTPTPSPEVTPVPGTTQTPVPTVTPPQATPTQTATPAGGNEGSQTTNTGIWIAGFLVIVVLSCVGVYYLFIRK